MTLRLDLAPVGLFSVYSRTAGGASHCACLLVLYVRITVQNSPNVTPSSESAGSSPTDRINWKTASLLTGTALFATWARPPTAGAQTGRQAVSTRR
jgi:hypothetical protein